MIYVGDYGFSIDFPVLFDLSGMTDVRMLILKPQGVEAFYDFQAGELTDVAVGGTLSYTIQDGDLSAPGPYLFQVISKDSTVDLGFDPFQLKVSGRAIANWWRTT